MYEEAGKIVFEKCIFNSSITFNSENTTYKNCEFNSNLTISASKNLDVSGLNVKGDLNLFVGNGYLKLSGINEREEINNQNIFIMQSPISLEIDNVVAKKLGLSKVSTAVDKFRLNNIRVGEVDIDNVLLSGELKIEGSEIKKLQIKRVGGTNKRLSITNSKLDEIDFAVSQLTNTLISECAVATFKLTDANGPDSILNIERSKINSLEFLNLYNKGIISLRKLEVPLGGLVSFKATNLGKADFIYCDFSEAELEFENSKITEAFLSETEFPKRVSVNGKINHGQAQLAFGQLATAFQKQGDNIRSLEYNSREIEAHYKSLGFNSSDFFRKINLGLNFLSNNFGRDWVRGILFSFCIGFFFFWLLLISTDNFQIGMPTSNTNLLPAFLKFMNPLRFYELESIFKNTTVENEIKLKPFSFFADFGGRVFITYGYYQTIQAFRKFGRK